MLLRYRVTLLAAVAATALAPAVAAASVPAAAASHPAAGGGTQLWFERYHDGVGTGSAGSVIAASPSGSAVFVGGTARRAFGGVDAAAVVAYNPTTGAQLWHASFPVGASGGSASISAMVVSPDSSTVFVTGETRTSGSTRYLTVAYNAATGATRWNDRTIRADFASGIAVSPDGSTVFVTGDGSPATVAYNAATGATLWTSATSGSAIGVSPGGSAVYVAGGSTSAPLVTAYNAHTGATLWSVSATLTSVTLAVSPDGSKVFTTGGGTTAAYTAATGHQIWTQHLGGPNTQTVSLAVSPDGSKVYAAGSFQVVFGTSQAATVAYNAATGATLWEQRGGAGPQASAQAIAISPDGSKVFITGDAGGQMPFRYQTVAYNAVTGAGLWSARHLTFDNDYASAVTVSPDGSKVFVTGKFVNNITNYMGTVAYRS